MIVHIFKINKVLVPRGLSSNTDSNLFAYWAFVTSESWWHSKFNKVKKKKPWFYPMHVLVRSLSSLVVPLSTWAETRRCPQIFSFSNSLLINCYIYTIYVYSLPHIISQTFFPFFFLNISKVSRLSPFNTQS